MGNSRFSSNAARQISRLIGGFSVLLVVSAAAFAADSYLDRRAIARLVDRHLVYGAAPSETLRSALDYFDKHVGRGDLDAYYLSPILRPLRPTALQVLQAHGDCASRARALIVMLDIYRVEATKRAVYDSAGNSVHAIVAVKTERGEYIVDPLFNVVHEDDSGAPVPLDTLAMSPDALPQSLARASAKGNPIAESYPLDLYALSDTRTINWEKSVIWKSAYRVASSILGEEAAREMPRPYLSEEPQLMMALVTGLLGIFSGMISLMMSFRSRART